MTGVTPIELRLSNGGMVSERRIRGGTRVRETAADGAGLFDRDVHVFHLTGHQLIRGKATRGAPT